jgi:hypothetical protein
MNGLARPPTELGSSAARLRGAVPSPQSSGALEPTLVDQGWVSVRPRALIRARSGHKRWERAGESVKKLDPSNGSSDALRDEFVDHMLDGAPISHEQSNCELVGCDGLKSSAELKDLVSESAVVGDDDVGVVGERRGDDVAVLAVDALKGVVIGVAASVKCQRVAHLPDPSTERIGIEVWERSEQAALEFFEDLGRDDRQVEVMVERGEEQVARQDRYQDVGVQDGNWSRHVRSPLQS